MLMCLIINGTYIFNKLPIMRVVTKLFICLLSVHLFSACSDTTVSDGPYTFADNLALINKLHNPIVLSNGAAQIIVLAEYQGRVMTSTLNGTKGRSIGWVNHAHLAEKQENPRVGGADRLWFGPEKGDFSLFFKPNTEQIPENIVIPPAFSTVPFDVVSQSSTHVSFSKKLTMENYRGFIFDLAVKRDISLFSNNEIKHDLGIEYNNLDAVAFGAQTTITNIGQKNWTKDTGLISIWDLGAFLPGEKSVAVIPTQANLAEVTSYFTPTQHSHTRIADGVVYYRANANYMNKIGIPPKNTLPIMASYNPQSGLFTVVTFQFDNTPNQLYVNSIWYPENHDNYNGDVINIFNHGGAYGAGTTGPFYELESSSHAKPLKIGDSQSHFQNTYHFQGDIEELNAISLTLLGVSLQHIETAFDDAKK